MKTPVKPDYYYRQAAALPFRDTPQGPEILVISNRKRNRWIIPKGIVEPDQSPAATALREASEEAGLLGQLEPNPIGKYVYRKWNGLCKVTVFVLKVEEEQSDYVEKEIRWRQWLPVNRARQLVANPGLRKLIGRFEAAYAHKK